MRTGFTPEFRKRAHRADPYVRTIVQAEVVESADIVQRRDQWGDADSLTGFSRLNDGRLVLFPGTTSVISHASGTVEASPLTRASGGFVGVVEWGGSEPESFQLDSITARLDPDVSGGGKVVTEWVMQVFALTRQVDELGAFEFTPICTEIRVTAGASVADVEFSFPAGQELRPKRFGAPEIDPSVNNPRYELPTSIVWIWAVDDDGAAASNVAWIMDDAQASISSSSNTISSSVATQVLEGNPWRFAESTQTPRMEFVKQTYSAATVTFTSNPLDLGDTPTGDVRFTYEAETPDDTTVTVQLRNDADNAWVTFTSGQTTDDIAGVGKRQTYDFRATLDPGSPANKTPAVISIGVEEVQTVDLDGLARVDVTGWQVDPVESRGSICQATITALKDGRKDYADRATEIAADHDPTDIAFRVYRGWKDSDGAVQGIHIDTFDVDDWSGEGPTLTFVCVGRNGRLSNVALPIYDTGNSKREPLSYENQTLKAVWDDILTTQLALDDRFLGPGVEDATTQVTKIIEDSEALTELDAIARFAGGGVISSQGRIKFAEMHGDDGREVVHVFGRGEIKPDRIGPGLRARKPLYFVPWDYDFDAQRFGDEVRSIAAASVLANKAWRIDGPDRLDSETAKWIDTEALATTVGERITNTMGSGLILWPFTSLYGLPHLEPGDLVAVPTDRFAAKDPNSTRGLKGQLYAIGPIQRVGDEEGTDFVVWVQGYADIRSSSATITRTGFANPEVLSLELVDDGNGNVAAVINGNADTGGFRVASSTSADPSLGTVQGESVSAATSHVLTTGTLQSLTLGQSIFVGVIATENSSAPIGAEQGFVTRAKYTRPYEASPEVVLVSTSFTTGATNVTADIVVAVADDAGQSGTLNIWTNKASTTDPDASAAPDQQVTVDNGETAGPSGSADVTATALDDVIVSLSARAGGRKEIHLEWVSDDGRSSGVKTYTLTRSGHTLAQMESGYFSDNIPKKVRAVSGGFDVDPDDVFDAATTIKAAVTVTRSAGGTVGAGDVGDRVGSAGQQWVENAADPLNLRYDDPSPGDGVLRIRTDACQFKNGGDAVNIPEYTKNDASQNTTYLLFYDRGTDTVTAVVTSKFSNMDHDVMHIGRIEVGADGTSGSGEGVQPI